MIFSYSGIFGFDISTWQDAAGIPGHVDFQKMKAYGARFVIIKAGQANYKDPDFETNWNGAKGVLPRASYFYYDNRVSPKVQATKYRDIMDGRLEGVCWLDLEDRNVGAYGTWRAWYDFIEHFRSLLPGVQVGVYSGHYYWEEFTMSATDAQREYFKQFPLWLASYTQNPFKPNYEAIRVPRPWTQCTMLQSGTPAIGIEAGVESKEIDYNQWNGDEASFTRYFSGATIPQPDPDDGAGPEPEPEPEAPMQGTVKSATNIRNSTPGGSYQDIGDMVAGDIITSDRSVDVASVKWYHLTNATRNGQPIITLGGLNVSQRADCWAYGPNIEVIGSPDPVPGLPVLNVTVSGEGYITQIVELRPR